MLIDTHCHLNFQAFEKDLPEIVRRAKEQGVEKIIIPGTDLISSRKAVEIAQTYPGCYAAIGIHPHHAQDPNLKINNELKRELENLLVGKSSASVKTTANKADKIVAIGEVGLDNHVYRKTKYDNIVVTPEIKQKQKDLLQLQLELGVIHNLPIILHCREAYPDMIQTISTFSRVARRSLGEGGHSPSNYIKPHLRGVFHCFSGSTQDLQLIITMGYYVGFDGNITYSRDYSTLVKSAPLERILLETDSPYLTPVPHRGTRNEPAYLPFVAQTVADYHSTSLLNVASQSTTNARSLFQI